MTPTTRKSVGGLVFLVVALAVLLFIPAWTFSFPQAWIYIAVFTVSVIAITAWLAKKDQALLQRRMDVGPKYEKEKAQKIVQFFAQFAFIAMYVVPAFDHRFNWSHVSLAVSIVAEIFVALGFYIDFVTFRENTYTSAIVEVQKNQQVISTGPYSHVRHPMYSGALLMLFATPFALGSLWGLFAFIPMLVAILARLVKEEEYLAHNLPGYPEYLKKVHSRLVPGIY